MLAPESRYFLPRCVLTDDIVSPWVTQIVRQRPLPSSNLCEAMRQRTYTEHPTRGAIEYRSGGIRSTALGSVEASTESVVITIPRHRGVEEGWCIRDDRDNREFEVRFRWPIGMGERLIELTCQSISGVASRIVAP